MLSRADMVLQMYGSRELAARMMPPSPTTSSHEDLRLLPLGRVYASLTLPTTSARTLKLSLEVTRKHSCFCACYIHAHSYCSQGSALIAAAISDATTTVRNQIVGTVLFGYTKNLQNLGRIPNYPADRLEVFCAVGDLVCDGTLVITAAHLSYSDEAASEAPRFLASKIGA